MERLKAYKFRIYPTKEQAIFFAKTFGCVRKVYNLMLNDRKKSYEEVKNDPSKKITFPTPAKYKKEFPFLKEVDSLALANAQLHLDKAYKNFFRDKSVGFPRFKSKKNPVQSYTTNNQKGTIALIDSKFIKVPKLKSLVKIKLHRQPKGRIKSATISRHSSGKYYISLLCKEEISELPKTNSAIGIDLGITDFAILSDGQKIDNNKFTSKMEKKLKREQRKLSRRQLRAKKEGRSLRDAKNYQKQRLVVAKLQARVRRQRNDFLHKVSTALINNHDLVVAENLRGKNMLKNHALALSISDVGWRTFLQMMEYKAKLYGRTFITVDPKNTTQMCSDCGFIMGKNGSNKLTLADREWTCPNCSKRHIRDWNAARNILAKGLAKIA